jgi:hypothetical protein
MIAATLACISARLARCRGHGVYDVEVRQLQHLRLTTSEPFLGLGGT